MSAEGEAGALVRRLAREGAAAVEVYQKEGRSRRFSRAGPVTDVQLLAEEGWAIRGGGPGGSFFSTGSGPVTVTAQCPAPAGAPLRLPAARPGPHPWREPADLHAPLMAEREALALLASIAEALAGELPGARLEVAALEDGSSTSRLTSSTGVDAFWRHRLAALRLEATWEEKGAAELYLAEREGRRFQPRQLARALADRLLVAARGVPPERERGPFVLAPAVGARILDGLRPLWLGPQAASWAARLQDGGGPLASPLLELVDDGGLASGVLTAPVDGEGVPTARLTILAEGTLRRPLLPWWQQQEGEGLVGCSRRPGWRDLPAPGPSHLYLCPRREVAPASLVAGISRGAYLLVAGAGVFDLEAGLFSLPVSGFLVRRGVASSPLTGGWLRGTIPALLRGVQAIARDLGFHPLGGMIGCPSLLLADVELRGTP